MITPKRIGFVDYCLNNFHAKVYLQALRGPLHSRGYEVIGATALQVAESAQWAKENHLAYYDSIEGLASHTDCFLVLAPSNPEYHLPLCERVFLHGKPTFVDKTFAPDLATAQRLFALADQWSVPLQTTSALRSSNVQVALGKLPDKLQSLFITSSGGSVAEYSIHPLELAVSCLGPEVEALMPLSSERHPQFILRFAEGRNAVIDFNALAEVPYTATLITDSQVKQVEVDLERLFIDAAASILDFFDQQKPQIDRRETLVIHRLLEMLGSALPLNEFHEVDLNDVAGHSNRGPHWEKQFNRQQSASLTEGST